jgi:cell division protein FtsQ
MARKSNPTALQEELYPLSAEPARDELDDARLVDLDVEEQSPFLRGQKRISARRSTLPKKTVSRLMWIAMAAAALCVAGVALAAVYRYGERSWRFRVDSSDDIEISGTQNVTNAQIMGVMGADFGRNIFFIPLAQQKLQLEQIPWVESASVMRFVPNRLKVEIHERTPVAFARVGPRIALIDAGGSLMELPPKHKYSFPVILGMNAGEPLSTRAPRMKIYNQLVRDLDSDGGNYSQGLSEVDISDLEDVKVRVNDPSGEVLVHLGSSLFLERYKIYVTHVQQWREQFTKLESVDLRYENQIIVNPDLQGTTRQPALTPAVAHAAMAAGVRPAALISRLKTTGRPVPKPAFELPEKKLDAKPATTTTAIAKTAAKPPAVNPQGAPARVKDKKRKPAGNKAKTAAGKKLQPNARSKASTRSDSVNKTAGKLPASSGAKNAGQKPSAAIAKDQGPSQ